VGDLSFLIRGKFNDPTHGEGFVISADVWRVRIQFPIVVSDYSFPELVSHFGAEAVANAAYSARDGGRSLSEKPTAFGTELREALKNSTEIERRDLFFRSVKFSRTTPTHGCWHCRDFKLAYLACRVCDWAICGNCGACSKPKKEADSGCIGVIIRRVTSGSDYIDWGRDAVKFNTTPEEYASIYGHQHNKESNKI